jgi:CelD/BcsL family acetyltransferase involved in cellulose biosynthesis
VWDEFGFGFGDAVKRSEGSVNEFALASESGWCGSELESPKLSADSRANSTLSSDVATNSAAFDISLVTDVFGLQALSVQCAELAKQTLEPNFFYEPIALIAALKYLPPENAMIVVVSHRSDGVTGIFPFQLEQKFRGLPLRSLKSLRHPYCFLCTPLVSSLHARGTVRAFLEWAEAKTAPASIIEFELVAEDGPFWATWTAEVKARSRWKSHMTTYQRALFRPAIDWATGVSRKHLKEFARLRRRLNDVGDCRFASWQRDEPIQPWIDKFLQLEASGWKGRSHTALASAERSCRYFTEVATQAAVQGSVQMLAIELNGVPIAMKCNFLANEGAFAFKIAYDERYEKYSPGVLLELFNMEQRREHCTETKWMDSCALPQHFMINRLWTKRRIVTTGVMASRGIGGLLVRNLPRYHKAHQFLMRWRKQRD